MPNSQLPNAGQILDTQITCVIVLNNALNVVYANPAAQQLLAQSTRKLLDVPFAELVNYISLDMELMKRNVHSEKGFTDNEVTMIVNGQFYILTITAQPLQGNLILLELSSQNNQRKLSNEQLQQAQQSASRELIRGLAHEIKNPLGGLRGAAQLLHKALPSPELTEYTKMIIEQADRLRNLVDRLLGPQQPSQYIKQTIHQSVERVHQLLALEKQNNIAIIRDYDPSLPEFLHSPEQIEQVLLNIGRNAIQALENTGGTIILRTRTAFQVTMHGKYYRLAARIDIEDDGSGIPAHIKDTLFYPMVSGRKGGSGLGLSIARNLVDQHSGKIELNSWPKHTEFSIYLPIK